MSVTGTPSRAASAEQRRIARRVWAAAVGGGAAGVTLTVRALAGDTSLIGVPWLAWPAAAVLLVGTLAAAVAVRPSGHRLPARLITAVLGLVTVLSLAASCFLLLDLIELALGGMVADGDGRDDWSTFAERVVAVVLAVLFFAAASSWRSRASGRCARCGETHATGSFDVAYPEPHAAPRGVRWTAYAGCAAFVPYLTVHGLNTTGVTPGSEDHYHFDVPLPLAFAVFVLALVGPAIFLLLGLVRPWGMVFPRWTLVLAGRRVPRFLPLSPVWLVAPTLALYGTAGPVYALAGGADFWGLVGAASLAFGGYGWALLVAAISYYRRTRPRCVDEDAW
jgi:hypothetical protein